MIIFLGAYHQHENSILPWPRLETHLGDLSVIHNCFRWPALMSVSQAAEKKEPEIWH